MPEQIGRQMDELLLAFSESQAAFDRARRLLVSPGIPIEVRLAGVNSLSTRPLRASRAEGRMFPIFDALNAKVKGDWASVDEAGQLRVTLGDSSAVGTVRMLNGLDILAGTVIAMSIGDADGLISADDGGVINPWKESALEISELGVGSNWFVVKLKATGRLLKRLDDSNIASGILLQIVLALQPFGGPGPSVNPPPLPPPAVTRCDISHEVGDLVDRVQRASPSATSFTISYECDGKTATVWVRPEVKPDDFVQPGR